jgi:hypothetical protein
MWYNPQATNSKLRCTTTSSQPDDGYDVTKSKRNKYSCRPYTLRDLQPTYSEVRPHHSRGQTQGKYK